MTRLPCRLLAAFVLLAGVAGTVVPGSARAEAYQTCAGFIDSLPATISTQGVWCLRKNLSTGITSGSAITIATNNVTIDCNDFKVGGLAGGSSSLAVGISADNKQNATVRHCNVRGFFMGILLNNGAGHMAEDNRLDNNLYAGIHVIGDNSVVQRNRVYDTGGFAGSSKSYGIYAVAHVIDNTVAGVFATAANAAPVGIYLNGAGSVVRNRVSGLLAQADGHVVGIRVPFQGAAAVDGNQLSVPEGSRGYGIFGALNVLCSNNIISGFEDAMGACAGQKDSGGNISW